MAKIIIAWEYDKDDFQISYLKYLQTQLISLGHQVYLVGTNYPANFDTIYPFLFAPKINQLSLHKPRGLTKIGSFGDRLATMGFKEVTTLEFLVHAWEHLFALLKPDLLITDCAPIANLTAFNEIAVIQMSDGFGLPPHHLLDFPRLRPDAPPLVDTHRMLHNVQWVQEKRGKSAPDSLPALMQGIESFIYHLPDFDPYLVFRSESYTCGPFFTKNGTTQDKSPQQFFAYLEDSYPDIEEIVIALTEFDKKGIFYIPGAPAVLRNYLQAKDMQICEHLSNIDDILSHCDYVIHHGNTSLAQAAIYAGIPQFMLPQHFESDWISHMLMERGIGLSIYPSYHPIQSTIDQIKYGRQKTSLREWAKLRAQQIKQRSCMPINEAVISATLRLLS